MYLITNHFNYIRWGFSVARQAPSRYNDIYAAAAVSAIAAKLSLSFPLAKAAKNLLTLSFAFIVFDPIRRYHSGQKLSLSTHVYANSPP
jgi:hypothetical protein